MAAAQNEIGFRAIAIWSKIPGVDVRGIRGAATVLASEVCEAAGALILAGLDFGGNLNGGPEVFCQNLLPDAILDPFGQVAEYPQSIAGPVTLKVACHHADGTGNTVVRLEKITHHDGREVENQYGATGSADDFLSRLARIRDIGEDRILAEYKYLGAATAVESTYPQPGVELAYFEGGGGSGDAWNGIERSGRIADHRWIKGAADIERTEYGYTRASLKRWRKNTVGTGQDEYYDYDGLFRRTEKIVHDTGGGRNDLVLRDRFVSGTPARHHALCDAMGSKTAITDAAGTVVERYRHSAFGKLTVLTGTFGTRSDTLHNWTTHFHGEERDPETGWSNS